MRMVFRTEQGTDAAADPDQIPQEPAEISGPCRFFLSVFISVPQNRKKPVHRDVQAFAS